MIEDPPILRVKSSRLRPSAAQIAAFQGVPTGFVVDAMSGGGALDAGIQPVGGGQEVACVAAGPALTADNGAADVLATQAALKFVQPGDILMAAVAGWQGCAAVGDSVMGMLRNAGGAGLVTDGPARDYAGIIEVGLPLWCSGLTPGTPFSSGPGKIGFPVQIGGQRVATGDMVVADRDGVVVVPFEQIDTVIARLNDIRQKEDQRDKAVAEGLTIPPHIDAILTSDKTHYEE